MIVLLDTHTLLWALEDSPRLSTTARSIIEDTGNVILVSVVSAWEIALKKSLGRLSAPDDLEAAVEAVGFTKRPVTFADAERLSALPLLHRDPFDRMLVCQALGDATPIVGCDPEMARYAVQMVW